MTHRYITRAPAFSDQPSDDMDAAYRETRSIVVFEPESRETYTGLVDASSVPIFRVADRVPMGFRRY